jgi:hypothetical protein
MSQGEQQIAVKDAVGAQELCIEGCPKDQAKIGH